MSTPALRLDWCSHAAAKYAVEHWHYSHKMPAGLNVKVGVWEMGRFVGAIVFGVGSGASTNGTRYGLRRSHDMAELVRVALRPHQTPVSRIVAIALRLLQRQSPGLRLVVSMADPAHNHIGAIYQAGGWIYTGTTSPDREILSSGEWKHRRTLTHTGTSSIKVPGRRWRAIPGKHRYLMPLDPALRPVLAPLAQPYPKHPVPGRASGESDTPATQAGEGAAMRPHGSILLEVAP